MPNDIICYIKKDFKPHGKVSEICLLHRLELFGGGEYLKFTIFMVIKRVATFWSSFE